MRETTKENKKEIYKAEFLWEHEENSIEEAGYEFANAISEEYREVWWKILMDRAEEHFKTIYLGDE